MNTSSTTVDMQKFPLTPVGNGNSPGGSGGVLLQGLPNFQSYWGFGKKKRSKRKARARRRGYDVTTKGLGGRRRGLFERWRAGLFSP